MDDAEVFWALHSGLPREGVGSDATTRTLLDLAAPLTPSPRALDVGCGPGRASLVLAGAGARVTAVDLHEPFLHRTRAAAAGAGLRVAVERASMTALPHPDDTFDLLWCEGAAYLMGVDRALRAWRRLLRPDGALVLTDAVWTTADPSGEGRAFWAQYPDMRDEAALVTGARAAGYDVLATHLLPDADWTDEYHRPLAAAVEAVVEALPDPDPATAEVLAEARREIDVRQAHRTEFGYLALVLRRR